MKALYEMDCEFLRHHDELELTRIQTILAIEGGMFIGWAQLFSPGSIGRVAVVVGGFFAALAITCLIRREQYIQAKFLGRVKEYEKEYKLDTGCPWGRCINTVALALLNTFNLGWMGCAFYRRFCG